MEPSADDPFGGLPFLGDMMRALSGQGPLNLDAARQFAVLGATGGDSEPNIDPTVRVRYEELARIAVPHVNDVCGTETNVPAPRIVTRTEWAVESLEDYRPLLTELAVSLAAPEGEPGIDDPLAQMMSGLNRMLAPALLGMAVGAMIGALAQRVFGVHDLPIPRDRRDVVLIGRTIDSFASEMGIGVDEMRLWVLSHEIAGHLLFNNDLIRVPLSDLIRRHVGGFRPDPGAIGRQLSEIDPNTADPMAVLQEAFSDPTLLLGAVESDEQRALRPALDAGVAMVLGFTDWVVDAVAVRLVGGDALAIADAVRRQHRETGGDDAFVDRLLGVRVGREQVERGKAFVQGIIDRRGDSGISIFLSEQASLPTPAEIDAPGLWLARITES